MPPRALGRHSPAPRAVALPFTPQPLPPYADPGPYFLPLLLPSAVGTPAARQLARASLFLPKILAPPGPADNATCAEYFCAQMAAPYLPPSGDIQRKRAKVLGKKNPFLLGSVWGGGQDRSGKSRPWTGEAGLEGNETGRRWRTRAGNPHQPRSRGVLQWPGPVTGHHQMR